jgi:hypothetical protein
MPRTASPAWLPDGGRVGGTISPAQQRPVLEPGTSCALCPELCALNTAGFVSISTVNDAISAERPSNSANLESISAEIQLTPIQSSGLIPAEHESNPAEHDAHSAEVQLIRSWPHKPCRVRQQWPTRTESITASATPGGVPPHPSIQNRLWYCEVKSLSGRLRASPRFAPPYVAFAQRYFSRSGASARQPDRDSGSSSAHRPLAAPC